LVPFALCAIALAGCGGSGGSGGNGAAQEPAPPVQGRVIDGYLVGAQVFWDCNDNHRIDDTEPWVTSTAGGRYTIEAALSPSCLLRAVVPAWAQDESTGTAVGREYRLSSMAGQPELITPITSMVTDGGYSPEQIATLTGFTGQPSQDYIAAGAAGVRNANVAGVIAAGLANLNGTMQQATSEGRAAAYRSLLSVYPADAFNVSATSPNSNAWLASVQGSLPVWEVFLSGFKAPEHRFVLEDVARSGLCNGVTEATCEERKTFVRGALSLAEKYRASEGGTINWTAVPASERSRLGASDVVPTNTEVEALRNELREKVGQFEEDMRAARASFNLSSGMILLDSSFALTIRAVETGATAFSAINPVAKGTLGTYKALKGQKTLKEAAKKLREVTVKGKLLKRLVADPACIPHLSYDVLDFFVDLPDEPTAVAGTVLDTTNDIAQCLLGVMKNSEQLKSIVALSFGATSATLSSADFFFDPQNRRLLLAEMLALVDVLTLGADIAQLPGLSAPLKMLGLLIDGAYQGMRGNELGDKALARLQSTLIQVQALQSATFVEYGRLFFAARVDPYIVLDVFKGFASEGGGAGASKATGTRGKLSVAAGRQAASVGSELVFTPGQAAWGMGGVQSYEWDFGDGTAKVVTTAPTPVRHAYSAGGVYAVRLRTTSFGPQQLTGESGERYEGTVESTITVQAAPVDRVVFADDFSAAVLDTTRWAVTNIDARSPLPSYSIVSGRLEMDVPGGTDGYMGVASGLRLTPQVAPISGDFEFSVRADELLREARPGYKDNSGISLEFGNAGVRIAGNFSGYWYGVTYGVYNRHRVHGYNQAGELCGINESLGLAQLYGLELRVRRAQGATSVGYRLAGEPNWTDWSCALPASATPTISLSSGDGGNTRSTGRFVGAVDNVVLRQPGTP